MSDINKSDSKFKKPISKQKQIFLNFFNSFKTLIAQASGTKKNPRDLFGGIPCDGISDNEHFGYSAEIQEAGDRKDRYILVGLMISLFASMYARVHIFKEEGKKYILEAVDTEGNTHRSEIELDGKDSEVIDKILENYGTVNILDYVNSKGGKEEEIKSKQVDEIDSLEYDTQKKNPLPCVDDKPI